MLDLYDLLIQILFFCITSGATVATCKIYMWLMTKIYSPVATAYVMAVINGVFAIVDWATVGTAARKDERSIRCWMCAMILSVMGYVIVAVYEAYGWKWTLVRIILFAIAVGKRVPVLQRAVQGAIQRLNPKRLASVSTGLVSIEPQRANKLE